LLKDRVKRLREKIKKDQLEIDAFLVSNWKNLFYLSGFDGEGNALITKNKFYLFTDPRYAEQAQKESPDSKIIVDETRKKDSRVLALKKIIEREKIKRIAIESESINYADYRKYEENFFSVEFIPTEKFIEQIRIIKDKEEITNIKRAAQITTESLKEVMESFTPGMRELDIATEIAYTMRKKGAQKEAFDLIVVSGYRTSLPHGKPSEKKINEGELITIDIGACYQSYNSDMTRTVILGKEDEKQKEIFSIVLEAQEEALQALKPGLKAKEIDAVARQLIEKKGYGKYFGHNLGHGVGLDIHELPGVSFNDETILSPGTVITIEPGIYLPEVGGIRIEDTVLITEDGYEILTWFPKVLNL